MFRFTYAILNGDIDTGDSRGEEYQQTGEGLYDNARMGGRRDEEDGTKSIGESGGGVRS